MVLWKMNIKKILCPEEVDMELKVNMIKLSRM
jgi:hypothetical protein